MSLQENIKDLIAQCMTRHEQEVRTLSNSTLGGTRFKLFIRRWEMNNEPPPPEETKSDRCVNRLAIRSLTDRCLQTGSGFQDVGPG
jgi:hypothetical protein